MTFARLLRVKHLSTVGAAGFVGYQLNDDLGTLAGFSKGFIAANTGIFLLWKTKRFDQFLRRHFMCSRENLMKGRLHTLLTASVSHSTNTHFLFNIFAFVSFFEMTNKTAYNTWQTLQFFGASSVCSNLTHLAFSKHPVLGSSGFIFSGLTFLIALNPRDLYTLIFPIYSHLTGLQLLDLSLLLNAVGLLTRYPISWFGHLGGVAAGLLTADLVGVRKLSDWQLLHAQYFRFDWAFSLEEYEVKLRILKAFLINDQPALQHAKNLNTQIYEKRLENRRRSLSKWTSNE